VSVAVIVALTVRYSWFGGHSSLSDKTHNHTKQCHLLQVGIREYALASRGSARPRSRRTTRMPAIHPAPSFPSCGPRPSQGSAICARLFSSRSLGAMNHAVRSAMIVLP
jgi:hypothetical protein